MTTYTVDYTTTENLAMQYVATDVSDWINNAAHERARLAIEEIVALAVQKFLDAGQTIPGSRDEIVQAAYDNGWVKTAAQRNAEELARLQNTPVE